jgi:peptidoglycan hydrolase-like protein with peptidoglycan-binding domain
MARLEDGTKELRGKHVVWAAIAASIILMTASGAAAAQKGTVNTDSLVIRQKTDSESKALQTLREGETLDILSSAGDWYKVSYGRFTGYVMKKYVKAVESASDASEKAIAKLGDAPAPMRKGDSGNDVKKLQRALEIVGAYEGSIDGNFGDLTEEAVMAFQKDKRLTADGVAGEDTIKALFGQEAAKPPETEKGMAGIESLSDVGDTPATSEIGDSGSKVKKLQQALKLKGYYNGPADGDFGEATETAVKAFQKAKGMSQDGVAGKTTIYILFGEKAANADEDTYKTEKLNWFDGGSTAVPKGATFTVKDVRTGKTFECRRWSGYNHLDAEPLTADDTAVMKSIYGGSWSWTRRPILVKYNGHVYACSMNGMPHEDDTISTNNFEGHFCIHFYKSKTHGTDRVDEEHQACVEIAARAKW